MEISLGKKFLFYGIAIGFVWFLIEFMAYGVYCLRTGSFSFSAVQGERKQIELDYENRIDPNAEQPGKTGKNWNVIHPYLGFVTEGVDLDKECPEQGVCDRRSRTYTDSPFIKSTDTNVIVAVIGGSFAHGVSYGTAPNFLARQLSTIPRFSGKNIILYHLAAGGYKQPQPLLKINYFLSLGAEFDLIINVDGFNEVVLPGVENLPKGVHPAFPRSWYYYVDSSLNPLLLALYGERENHRVARVRWARFFSSPLISFLPSANLFWQLNDARFIDKIKKTDVELVGYRGDGERKMQYATTGPDYIFTSWDVFYQDMVEIWARSSLQLYTLCRSQGIEYFHFLQPNQYVAGSKPMLEKEKKIAFSPDSKYGKVASEGYPYLIRQGDWLLEKGVPYYDLTMLFSETSKELYIDDCCHLNMPGYDTVVMAIKTSIENYETSSNRSINEHQ